MKRKEQSARARLLDRVALVLLAVVVVLSVVIRLVLHAALVDALLLGCVALSVLVSWRALSLADAEVAERKRAEEAVRSATQRMQLALDAAKIGMWEWDLPTNRVVFDDRLFAMYGLEPTPEHLFHGTMWIERLHEDDRADEVALYQQMKRAPKSAAKGDLNRVFRIVRPDGVVRHIESAGAVITDEAGEPTRIVGMNIDVSESKEKETQLRAVFEHAALGLALVDPRGGVIRCNPALEQFLGYSAAELQSMTFAQFTHPDDLNTDLNLYSDLQAGKRDSFQMEKRYIRKDGTVVWGRLIVSAFRGAASTTFGISLVEDITAQIRADKEKKELEACLRQSQKMQALGTLAGGIAHDFNNILAAISGNAQLAADEPLGRRAEECLNEIGLASTRASDLVRQILLFARQQEVPRTAIRLEPVIEEALKLLRATLPPMVEIVPRFAPRVPLVLADATQIHQMIMNLGTNAAHAMSARGGTLAVDVDVVLVDAGVARTATNLSEGRYVRISVTDTGCGMTPEIRERIFEPFFTTKQPGAGTGLGLAVVHGIIKGAGGGVRVDSDPGKGTAIHVYLPPSAEALVATPSAQVDLVLGHGERVIYVDDEAPLVPLMKRQLERLGYVASGFTDAAAALAAFRADPRAFDALFTDIAMPGMTGIEIARAVREIRPDLPILMTSGCIRDEDAETAAELGVRELVKKPSTPAELSRALALALRRPQKAPSGSRWLGGLGA